MSHVSTPISDMLGATQTPPHAEKRVIVIDDAADHVCTVLITLLLALVALIMAGSFIVGSLTFDFRVTGGVGDKGPSGAQGKPGSTGPTGATGADGPTGPTGRQGEQGDAGVLGARGPTGLNCWDVNSTVATVGTVLDCFGGKGPVGFDGDPGDKGPRGVTGAAGGLRCYDTLYTGTCVPGNDRNGDGACNITDCAGAICSSDYNLTKCKGFTGPPGPIGARGPTGATGPSGTVQGARGATGCECWNLGCRSSLTIPDIIADNVNGDGYLDRLDCLGAPGPTGTSGDPGGIGPKGATGDTGATGATGATGVAGATGPTAANGTKCSSTPGARCSSPQTGYPLEQTVYADTGLTMWASLVLAATSQPYRLVWFNSSFYTLSFTARFTTPSYSFGANPAQLPWATWTPSPDTHNNASYTGNRVISLYTNAITLNDMSSSCYTQWRTLIPALPAVASAAANATWVCTMTLQNPTGPLLSFYGFTKSVQSGHVPCQHSRWMRSLSPQPFTVLQMLNSATPQVWTIAYTCLAMVSL